MIFLKFIFKILMQKNRNFTKIEYKSFDFVIKCQFYKIHAFIAFVYSTGKVLRMMYVWALCRDQDELNPYAAWRLLDISASSTEQIL